MPLYCPRAFRAPAASGPTLAEAWPFATLITPMTDDEPWISHLLMLPDPDDAGALLGHLSAASGHCRVLFGQPSVAIFHGPHSYVSPRWYVSPGPQVPTWNYTVAHAHGRAAPLDDEGTRQVLVQLSQVLEPAGGWAPDFGLAPVAAELPGLVAFRFHVSRWDVKTKLSQNRTQEDRAAVARHLAQGDAMARAVAAAMEDPLPSGAASAAPEA